MEEIKCTICGRPANNPWKRIDGYTLKEHCLATMHEVSPFWQSTVKKWRKSFKAKFGYVSNGLDGKAELKAMEKRTN